MTKNTPAILWDMDGTIIDSKACHFQSWIITLAELGINLDEEHFLSSFGRNNKISLPNYLGYEPDPEQFEQIVDKKESLFLDLMLEESSLISGVESWLADGKERGIRQAVASSSDDKIIGMMLDKFNLAKYFDAIQPGAHLPAKPSPDIFLKAADLLDAQPKRCVVIEDSLAGVEGGKNAGMQCVAVTSSFSREMLTMADVVVDDYTGPLTPVLQSLQLL